MTTNDLAHQDFILSDRSGSDSRFSIRESRFEPHQRCQFPSAINLSTMLQSTKVSVNWDLVEVALFGQKKNTLPECLSIFIIPVVIFVQLLVIQEKFTF